MRIRPSSGPAVGPLPARALVCCLLLAGAAAAAPPAWVPAAWTDHPVRVVAGSRAQLVALIAAVPVASFDRDQVRPPAAAGPGAWIWEPRVTDREEAALRAAGARVEVLPDLERAGREEAERAWARPGRQVTGPAKAAGAVLAGYPTHAEIGQLLAQAAADHPAIARTVTWGLSVQGRQMWGIVISDDVAATEPEPEVRLVAAIHGNEPPGMILLLDLVEHLTDNYGQPGFDDVTALVDGAEIHILPLYNPDGYAAGLRTNANGIDLNRNFSLPAGTHPVLEPENQVFMAYSEAHDFAVSQNGHAGALVVNYPWDYTYTRAPDDAALIDLSLEYSTRNLPMYEGWFTDGITNGADWYVVTGSLQDWSYHATDCIDLTIEVSDAKWPVANSLPALWDDNRESLLALIRAAGWGVRGVVTDAATGLPLDATVTVAGNAKPVSTDAEHGDYVKLLPSGTWDITVAAAGYQAQVLTGVATTWGTATVLDVALQPDVSPVPPRAPVLALAAQPNPFNPATTIRLTLPEAGAARLVVHDLQGRRVRTLVDGGLAGGGHAVRWDGRDDAGRPLPGGVYFARLAAAGGMVVTKLTLVK